MPEAVAAAAVVVAALADLQEILDPLELETQVVQEVQRLHQPVQMSR